MLDVISVLVSLYLHVDRENCPLILFEYDFCCFFSFMVFAIMLTLRQQKEKIFVKSDNSL